MQKYGYHRFGITWGSGRNLVRLKDSSSKSFSKVAFVSVTSENLLVHSSRNYSDENTPHGNPVGDRLIGELPENCRNR